MGRWPSVLPGNSRLWEWSAIILSVSWTKRNVPKTTCLCEKPENRVKPIELVYVIVAFAQWQSDINSISLFFPTFFVHTFLTCDLSSSSFALFYISPPLGSCNSLCTPHPPTAKGDHHPPNNLADTAIDGISLASPWKHDCLWGENSV